MFKFLNKLGMEGSPLSRMNDQQKIQALGAAFSGDQNMLGELMGQLGPAPQKASPILNRDGEDISAAFGPALGPMGMADGGKPGALLGVPGMLLGRKFGFGRKR